MVAGKSNWHARYQVPAQQSFSVPDELDVERVSGALLECFAEAHRLYVGHLEGRMQGAGRYKVLMTSGFTETTPLVEGELPKRVVATDEKGLIEYPQSHLVRKLPPLKSVRSVSPRP